METGLAMFLRPFAVCLALLLLGIVVVYPIRRFMPDGRLKCLLLTDVGEDANARRLKKLVRR